jgi:hypothetical protein
MSGRKDSVEMEGGITHLPAEFREVARLANRAGLDGFEIEDVDCGLDMDAIHAIANAPDASKMGTPELPWPTARILITYRQVARRELAASEIAAAVRMREALERIFFMDKCPQPGDGCAQCIARAVLDETNIKITLERC